MKFDLRAEEQHKVFFFFWTEEPNDLDRNHNAPLLCTYCVSYRDASTLTYIHVV